MAIAVIFPLVSPGFAGKGSSRAFAKIEGREVFLRSVELYTPRDQVVQRIIVVPPDDLQTMAEQFSAHLGFQGVTVAGGTSDWFGCVARGLERLEERVDRVLVHDPCCPAVPFTLLDALEEALAKQKQAAGVVPVVSTRGAFADVEAGALTDHVEMSQVMQVQSPQLFRRAALVAAYAGRGANQFIDDAELVTHAGGRLVTVPGSRFNLRIDSDEMVRLGKDLIGHMPKPKSRSPLTPFGEAEW